MADSNNDRRRKMFSDRSEYGKLKAARRNSATRRAAEARQIKARLGIITRDHSIAS